jgi:hypothetical protein
VRLDTALPWLALCLTLAIGSAPFGAAAEAVRLPENFFLVPLRQLEGCELPAATAQAIVKKEAFKRAEKKNRRRFAGFPAARS